MNQTVLRITYPMLPADRPAWRGSMNAPAGRGLQCKPLPWAVFSPTTTHPSAGLHCKPLLWWSRRRSVEACSASRYPRGDSPDPPARVPACTASLYSRGLAGRRPAWRASMDASVGSRGLQRKPVPRGVSAGTPPPECRLALQASTVSWSRRATAGVERINEPLPLRRGRGTGLG